MPFPLRTVAPLRLCRLEEDGVAAPRRDKEEGPAAGLLFGSLEEVCSHSLVSLLWQLSDLSRCATDVFGGIQKQTDSLGRRSAQLQRRLDSLRALATRLDHRKVKIPVSNLDEEKRWTVHYTAPWHQQENVFLPSTRPACVEDLHRQAKLNLKSVLRECDKLRRDGYRSSQYYSQGPTFSASGAICESYQDDFEEVEQKCSTPSPEEEKLIGFKRPKTSVSNEFLDINTQTNWTKSLPLPTPEEKMRQQAQAVQTDVIPINVTATHEDVVECVHLEGENFDRQASIRRSLIYTDTVVRWPKKVKRRKTITGVPDNIQRELVGTSQNDFRGHSLCVPDHYSTLGRLDSYRSSVQRSDTKDCSCQTEEVKVVPPSVRRIRAQKGQGIAAQMSQLSTSSGNMSVMSDSAGLVFASHLNSDLGFHSLPRSGVRGSLQLLERRHSLSKSTEDAALSHQISKLQADDSTAHTRNSNRLGVLQKPKSQEVRSIESEQPENPACMVSPHTAYSTSIIPNATLSSSSEVIVIHTTQSAGLLDSKITQSSSYTKPKDTPVVKSMISTKDQHHSSSGSWNETNSAHHSQSPDAVSSNTVMMLSLEDSGVRLSGTGTVQNGLQNMAYSNRNNLSFPSHSQDSNSRSNSSYSVDKTQRKAENNTEHCGFKSSGNEEMVLHKPKYVTQGCSTPVSNLSTGSLERTLTKDDSSSLYSVDHDGYCTSMHMDTGLKSDKICSNNGFENPRHSVINVFDGIEKKPLGDLTICSNRSLSRSISFKKAKKPPLPPSRTDSLRRVPKKKAQSNGQVLDDMLIASLQHSLQLNLKCKNGTSPSQSPSSDYDDPWVLRSRSQSSVSASSSMMSATGLNAYSICALTPSQSDTSSIKSEFADQWSYYSDYPSTMDDPLKSPVTHSANTEPKLNDYNVGCLNDGARALTPQVPSGLAKPKTTSPEKSHRVTSPSSGYSSQSNTPTALTPVPVILKSMSAGNGKPKAKPKVPERKSSLLSSVSMSSSSTSLSSNTSAEGSTSIKKLDPFLGFPLVIHSPVFSPDSADYLLPPPPPLLTDVIDLDPPPASPNFPPPPPEAVINAPFSHTAPWFHYPSQETSLSHFSTSLPSVPYPPSPSVPSSAPPPAPPLGSKFSKDAHKCTPYSFNKYNQENSCYSTVKQAFSKEDSIRPPMPLVTTKALQMVQLRSVRRVVVSEAEQSAEPAPQSNSQEKLTDVFSAQLPLKSHVSVGHNDSLEVGKINPHGAFNKNFVYSPRQKTYLGLRSNGPEFTSGKTPRNTANPVKLFASDLPSTSVEEAPVRNEDSPCDFETSSLHGQSGSPSNPEDVLPNKKPPPVSKKPKLFLIVPPPQPDVTAEKIAEVGETVRCTNLTTRDAAVAPYSQAKDYPTDGLCSFEMDSGSLVPEGGASGPTSYERVETNVSALQPRQEEQSCLCKESNPGRNGDSISIADRHPFQGKGCVEEFELDAANSFSLQSRSNEDGNEVVSVPAKPRTTEDLFAAIHRSKRKILGRKDSEDDHTQNHSPSPPVTPTGASPNLVSLKQAGSIQRNVRKSSTSNDNFKALLLKKGSRSDASFRMSAAEMLKNTDPRFQRTKIDSSLDFVDSATNCSPTKSRRAPEEWVKSEGLMPRSLSFSSTRYSRSRTPPSAASSKYNVRNRIQSSPMTVISEGDVEAGELSENRPHRSSEEQFDVFDSDEMDSNEEVVCTDETAAHPDLLT